MGAGSDCGCGMKGSCSIGADLRTSLYCSMDMPGIEKSVSWTKVPGTPKRSIGADERLLSSRAPARGGSSIGEGPWWGDRAETEEQSDTSEGAPSAEIWENAEGDGRGVSYILPKDAA